MFLDSHVKENSIRNYPQLAFNGSVLGSYPMRCQFESDAVDHTWDRGEMVITADF